MLGQKYFKMAMFGFVGISIYLFIKKNPTESKSLLNHANDIIRYMPIDRNTADMVSPLFDLTSAQQKLSDKYGVTTYNKDGSVSTIPKIQKKEAELEQAKGTDWNWFWGGSPEVSAQAETPLKTAQQGFQWWEIDLTFSRNLQKYI